jgi:hypothetical protein
VRFALGENIAGQRMQGSQMTDDGKRFAEKIAKEEDDVRRQHGHPPSPGLLVEIDNLPILVYKRLREAGVDYRAPEIRRALDVAMQAIRDSERSAAWFRIYKRSFWDRVTDSAFYLLGFASLLFLLSTQFHTIVNGIKTLLLGWSVNDFPIAVAYAQSISEPLAPKATLPILLAVVYFLLGIAYLVTLIGFTCAKDPKVRSNSMEVFKGLNAFFIGAISGKLT